MLKRATAVAAALTGMVVLGSHWAGAQASVSAPPLPPVLRRSLITVRHADIDGQVFIASERAETDEIPAVGVTVQVRDLENKEVLRSAATDAEGRFKLPMLDPSTNLLLIGSLKLKLLVTPETTPQGERPKVVIVIIPKQMTRFRD